LKAKNREKGREEMALGRTNKMDDNRIWDKRRKVRAAKGMKEREKKTMFPSLWTSPVLV
jgi:hypothetical protein